MFSMREQQTKLRMLCDKEGKLKLGDSIETVNSDDLKDIPKVCIYSAGWSNRTQHYVCVPLNPNFQTPRRMMQISFRNIVSSVYDLYQRSNSTISDFNACNSDTLDRLHSSFCMHMYGCEPRNLSSSYTDKYIIAWRKIRDEFGKFPLTVTSILFII